MLFSWKVAAPSLTGNKVSLGQRWQVETVLIWYFFRSGLSVKYSIPYLLSVMCQISIPLCPQTCQEESGALPEHFVCSVSSHVVVFPLGEVHTLVCIYASVTLQEGRWMLWIKEKQCMKSVESAGTERRERWRSSIQTCFSLWEVLASSDGVNMPPFFSCNVVIRATHRKWAIGCQETIKSQCEIIT